ncbi:MAG: hypothetical protein AAF645_04860 [Myxococcota bacterium]
MAWAPRTGLEVTLFFVAGCGFVGIEAPDGAVGRDAEADTIVEAGSDAGSDAADVRELRAPDAFADAPEDGDDGSLPDGAAPDGFAPDGASDTGTDALLDLGVDVGAPEPVGDWLSYRVGRQFSLRDAVHAFDRGEPLDLAVACGDADGDFIYARFQEGELPNVVVVEGDDGCASTAILQEGSASRPTDLQVMAAGGRIVMLDDGVAFRAFAFAENVRFDAISVIEREPVAAGIVPGRDEVFYALLGDFIGGTAFVQLVRVALPATPSRVLAVWNTNDALPLNMLWLDDAGTLHHVGVNVATPDVSQAVVYLGIADPQHAEHVPGTGRNEAIVSTSQEVFTVQGLTGAVPRPMRTETFAGAPLIDARLGTLILNASDAPTAYTEGLRWGRYGNWTEARALRSAVMLARLEAGTTVVARPRNGRNVCDGVSFVGPSIEDASGTPISSNEPASIASSEIVTPAERSTTPVPATGLEECGS